MRSIHSHALPALVAALAACAAPRTVAYRVDDLRATLAARTGLSPDSVVIPFEMDEGPLAEAHRIVRRFAGAQARGAALIAAMRDPLTFGLIYGPYRTAAAADTLRAGRGNCLSLAAVLVGLARGVGLDAYFADVTETHEESEREGDLVVRSGHITAVVATERGFLALDLDGRIESGGRWRLIDDAEATAHYYNNLGYELLLTSGSEAQAMQSFELAVKIAPHFYRAWNNLGVLAARLDRDDDAFAYYQRALAADATSASPYLNLAQLHLKRGEMREAFDALTGALRREQDHSGAQTLLRHLSQGPPSSR